MFSMWLSPGSIHNLRLVCLYLTAQLAAPLAGGQSLVVCRQHHRLPSTVDGIAVSEALQYEERVYFMMHPLLFSYPSRLLPVSWSGNALSTHSMLLLPSTCSRLRGVWGSVQVCAKPEDRV